MPDRDTQIRGPRFLASGEEAGTSPEDRPFRPDVEGLRAVAVLLVVLFHSGISFFSGGYIGVDVFFVISGFVITGVLLRERESTGRTSILAFYGRRCRRIIPAASLVIVVTVIMTYALIGSTTGGRTATDGRWASVFLVNFHFTSVGTNYLGSALPPSPLEHFWSLSVEEQFYVVFPTFFVVLASIRTRIPFRTRLALGLVLVIAASLTFSIVDTVSNPAAAYFSPFTRAWELAVGALVAIATPWLKTMPDHLAAVGTWLGLGLIVISATAYDARTTYPGWLVMAPVLGAACVIAGGVRTPLAGAESLLGLPPFRWLGRLSYSLYLWHWPILIIVAEHAGKTSLPVAQSLGLDLVALVLSAITYVVVENPIRHARALRHTRWATLVVGAGFVAATFGFITMQVQLASTSGVAASHASEKVPTNSSLKDILRLVAQSRHIRTVPSNLHPSVSEATAQPVSNLGEPPTNTGCVIAFSQSTAPACNFGDRSSSHTMLLYGDSHAGMWYKALDDIAVRIHWRLVVLFKSACPASPLSTRTRGVRGESGTQWKACDQWHRYAIARINHIDPDLLIISQDLNRAPDGLVYTPRQWQRGLQQLLERVTAPRTVKVVLGNIPITRGPVCLAQHVDDVQACAGKPSRRYDAAERRAALLSGARYIDITPWFCTRTCSPIIGTLNVFFNTSHVAVGYTRFLESVLAQSLGIAPVGTSS